MRLCFAVYVHVNVVDLTITTANGETYESLKSHIIIQEMEGFAVRLLDLEGC